MTESIPIPSRVSHHAELKLGGFGHPAGVPGGVQLEFLREVVPEAEIDRVAYKLGGAYVCAYEVRPLVL